MTRQAPGLRGGSRSWGLTPEAWGLRPGLSVSRSFQCRSVKIARFSKVDLKAAS